MGLSVIARAVALSRGEANRLNCPTGGEPGKIESYIAVFVVDLFCSQFLYDYHKTKFRVSLYATAMPLLRDRGTGVDDSLKRPGAHERRRELQLPESWGRIPRKEKKTKARKTTGTFRKCPQL